MPALPGISAATASSATEGDVKNFLTEQHGFLSGLFGSTGQKPAARAALQVPLHSKTDKSGAYTVVASDQGCVINCTGTWTLSITAAATLGDGFLFAVMNSGAGTITIDPSGTETIDGSTTKTLSAAKLLLVYCNGTSFSSVGSVDAASIAAALGYTPANTAHNHSGTYLPITYGNNVGSLILANKASGEGGDPGVGVTGTGSGKNIVYSSQNNAVGTSVSGSWICLGVANNGYGVTSLWRKVS